MYVRVRVCPSASGTPPSPDTGLPVPCHRGPAAGVCMTCRPHPTHLLFLFQLVRLVLEAKHFESGTNTPHCNQGRQIYTIRKYHVILQEGLGHPWISVSVEGGGGGGSCNQPPPSTEEQLCIFGCACVCLLQSTHLFLSTYLPKRENIF